MVTIGKRHELRILRRVSSGLILEAAGDELLLPRRFAPDEAQIGDRVEVFVYTDSEDLPIATTQTPLAQADEFAGLVVKAVSKVGVFLDWGLDKDLLLPYGRQSGSGAPKVGDRVVVRVFCDSVSGRMVASARVETFLSRVPRNLRDGQAVELLPYRRTPLGVEAIVNDCCSGLLFVDQGEAPPAIGVRVKGYVQQLRSDGKLDLVSRPGGARGKKDARQKILDALDAAGGALALGDKSAPADIQATLGMSKKAFKMAVGNLYRERKVEVTDHQVRRVTRRPG